MSAPLVTYKAVYGGKYHAATIAGVARCRATIEVDVDNLHGGGEIHVQPGQDYIHPFVCQRCIDNWKKENKT